MSTFSVVTEAGYELLATDDWLEACHLQISRHGDGRIAHVQGVHPSHAGSLLYGSVWCCGTCGVPSGHHASWMPCGHPDVRQLPLAQLVEREERLRGLRRIDSIAWVVRTDIRHTLNGLGSSIEQLRYDMASGGHLSADGAVHEVDSFMATLRHVRRQLADGQNIPDETREASDGPAE